MHGVFMVALLHAALAPTTGSEYTAAFNQAEEAGKPLLVLVGAGPEYSEMKQEIMPELQRAGGLKEVVFTEVDADDIPDLTRQLRRGQPLPQLVLYTPVGKLWRRTHIAGAPSQGEIQAFLKREIAKGQEVAFRASRKTTTISQSQANVMHSYSVGGS